MVPRNFSLFIVSFFLLRFSQLNHFFHFIVRLCQQSLIIRLYQLFFSFLLPFCLSDPSWNLLCLVYTESMGLNGHPWCRPHFIHKFTTVIVFCHALRLSVHISYSYFCMSLLFIIFNISSLSTPPYAAFKSSNNLYIYPFSSASLLCTI